MRGMNGEADDRIVELETKASYQEAALLDLSKAIVDQGARIDKLEATVRALRDRIKETSGEGQSPLPENERPPHY
jgi:SlyX protein